MDTRKKRSERSMSTRPDFGAQPLKVQKDTLKDLGLEARNAQHVKGGVPTKYGTDS